MNVQQSGQFQQRVGQRGPGAMPLQIEPIPRALTPTVGRERELEVVLAYLALEDMRLLTLTGPGGVGKTRIALQTARRLEREPDIDVVFVNLAPIAEPTLVAAAIAGAIGVPVGDSRTLMARLHGAIGDRPLLFVLDNFEQVISEAVTVAELLSQCPNVKALVTSRMPLHVRGEQELPVSPLESPDPASSLSLEQLAANDAVALFVQRARATTPEFALTERNARTVAAICARLDGLPLAIELAAARIRFFTSESLLSRLDDRLAILTGGPRDAPSRQQTMRSAIQWSHDLLDRDEQVVFRRLSLLRGTFALQTAIEILEFPARDAPAPPDVLGCLLSLLDKNLIIRVQREDRFRMLATIREFGMAELERSGETDILRERLLRFYVDLLASHEGELIGPNQHLVMRRLDGEVGNLRVALQAGLDLPEPAGVLGVRLASMLWRYWLVRGQLSEGSRWLSRVLNLATGVPVLDRASALNRLGNLSLELSQYDKAQGCYQQSFELYQSIGDKSGMGDELNNLGLMEIIQGKFDSARVLLERSQALRHELGDESSLPSILTNLGDIATYEGDYDAATAYQTEALAIRRSLGNKRGIALCCGSLGMIALLRGDFDGAERWFAEGMTYSDELDDAFTRASILLGQGRLAVRRGMIGDAVELLTGSLRILQPMGSRRLLAEVVDVLAATGAMAGHYGVAARLTGSTAAMREEYRIGISARSIVEQESLRATLGAQLGADRYDQEVDSGRRLTLDAAVAEALELAARISGAADGALAADGVQRGAAEAAGRLGLTRREREVLVLLVDGLGDKEIADRLFISPRTAMTHVSNILAKLGVNRRAMAARVAVDRGLVTSPTTTRPPDQPA